MKQALPKTRFGLLFASFSARVLAMNAKNGISASKWPCVIPGSWLTADNVIGDGVELVDGDVSVDGGTGGGDWGDGDLGRSTDVRYSVMALSCAWGSATPALAAPEPLFAAGLLCDFANGS